MPEGDTLHLLAARLAPLVGEEVVSFALPRSTQPTGHLTGARVARIEAVGKNLLVRFEGPELEGTWVLHIHLRMNGRVRLVPRASLRERPSLGTVAVLVTPRLAAVCTNAPVCRLVREGSLLHRRDDPERQLGPDLVTASVDLDDAARRLASEGDLALGIAVMRQRVVAGIGNVWKSESLFARGLDPFAPVRAFEHDELRALLEHASRLMRANVAGTVDRTLARSGPGELGLAPRITREDRRAGETRYAVYERRGEPCLRCETPIAMARQETRSTYYCPRCQPRRA